MFNNNNMNTCMKSWLAGKKEREYAGFNVIINTLAFAFSQRDITIMI